jgi:dolichol-phosphate mannosyltransferase
MPERNRYIRGMRPFAGFRQTGIPFKREARKIGQRKYTFRKSLKLAYDGIFSSSYFPLTFVTILGFGVSILSFIGIIVVIWLRLFTDKSIPGFASISVLVLFLGGIQLLSLGIVGEYIRRIYDEAKRRPLYIIARKIGF